MTRHGGNLKKSSIRLSLKGRGPSKRRRYAGNAMGEKTKPRIFHLRNHSVHPGEEGGSP